MFKLLSLIFATALLSSSLLTANEPTEELKPYGPQLFDVADASTKVKVFAFVSAEVRLEVKGLTLKDGCLKGYYFLTVPMKESKNESGVITLNLTNSPIEYIEEGGKMAGTGECLIDDGRPTRILKAEIVPNSPTCLTGKLHLQVDTTERVLNFVTDYTIDRDKLSAMDIEGLAAVGIVPQDSNL